MNGSEILISDDGYKSIFSPSGEYKQNFHAKGLLQVNL